MSGTYISMDGATSVWASLTTPLKGPPNGGVFGWGACAGTFLAVGVCVSLETVFGQLSVSIFNDAELQFSRAFLSLVISFQVFAELFLGVPVSWGVSRFGPRIVVAAGGVLLGAGIYAASFAVTAEYFFLTYAVCGGVGLALVYGAATMALGFYFTTNAAAASSISGTGVGLGMIFFSQLVAYLTEHSGWRACLRVLGVLSGVACVISSVAFVPVGPSGEALDLDKGKSHESVDKTSEPAQLQTQGLSITVRKVGSESAAPSATAGEEDALSPKLAAAQFSPRALSSAAQRPSPLLFGLRGTATAATRISSASVAALISQEGVAGGGSPLGAVEGGIGAPAAKPPLPPSRLAAAARERSSELGPTETLVGAPPSPLALASPKASAEASSAAVLQAPLAAVVASDAPAGAAGAPPALQPPVAPAESEALPVELPAQHPPHAFSSAQFWALALCMAFNISSCTIPEVHLGAFIEDANGLPPSVTSTCYSLMGIGGLLTRVMLFFVTVRYDLNLLLLLQFACVALGVSILGLAAHGSSPTYLYTFSFLMGGFYNVSVACISPVLQELFGAEMLHKALGAMYTLRAVPVLLAPVLAAIVIDRAGFATVWTLTGVLCVLSSFPVCLAHMGCKRRQEL